jgi:RNA polymerase sigma-70 factor (ECF subfamily)
MVQQADDKGDVTRLLQAVSAGNEGALDQLVNLIYAELRRCAARHLRRERPDHTLSPTALVHEAYFKLVDQRTAQWQNRAQFLAVASQAMRRILVDYARTRVRVKRGGAQQQVAISSVDLATPERPLDLVALDAALDRLARRDERQSRIVELRYFAGLSVEETAEVLGVSPATVKRQWTIAKAWLFAELHGADATPHE